MPAYAEVFKQVQQLTASEQLQLLEALAALIRQEIAIEQQPLPAVDADPLIGLFSGSPDLATQSEDILEQEINAKSGRIWKEDCL